MISLAIVIAVSEYSGDATPLPACKNDGAAIATLINGEQRFAETLFIDSETSSKSVKQRLIEFVAKHKHSEVEDVFFYFTGHGEFHGGEFYYLLSDYRSAARKQTSLENKELDNLIRSLRPTLFAKVVDACHSGFSYVKDGSELRKHLDSSIDAFKKVYFMFSSQSNQPSYQDKALSYFTRRFVESIILGDSSSVRYKDIIDYVSDAFTQDTIQTPFFVTQADHTEIFLEVSEDTRKTVTTFLPTGIPSIATAQAGVQELSLVEFVKRDASLYCSEEKTVSVLVQISESIHSYKLPRDLSELYSLVFEQIPLSDFRYGDGIGIWIDKNLTDKRYFVSVEKETRQETKKVLKSAFEMLSVSSLSLGQADDGKYKTVTEVRQYIVGFKPSVELPFGALALYGEPKYLNLFACRMYVVPIVSMTHIRLFWSYVHLDHSNWKQRKFVNKFEWATDEVLTTDSAGIEKLIRTITSGFETFAFAPIKSKWGQLVEKVQSTSLSEAAPIGADTKLAHNTDS